MEQLGAGTLMEIRKEAAAWLVEMDQEPERWNRQRFIAWLKSSPRHMEEFLEQTALWAALSNISPGSIDLHPLSKESDNVVKWTHGADAPPAGPRTWFRWWFVGLTAALVLIVSGLGLWRVMQQSAEVLTTAVGEQRAVRLDDGSVVHLNTDTRIRIHFTETAREVNLIQGEALFTVKRDVNRPFRVQSDDIQVEALGTQFNVRRRAGDTIVSVVEGRVAVVGSDDTSRPGDAATVEPAPGPAPSSSNETRQQASRPAADVPYEAGRPAPAGALAVLGAGEQVSVSSKGAVEQVPAQTVTAATAWRQRQLVFSNTPLGDVAAEVARYNVAPRLLIEGEAIQGRRLNGVFAADDPESLVQFLARDPSLSVTRDGDTVVIRLRDRPIS